MAKKVFVALSGGVDSAAAAVLLLRRGYEVSGVTMNIYGSSSAADDAARVAETLKIEHFVFDFAAEFEELVIEPFINEYLHGRTPNPCVLCNPNVKWGLLLERALQTADFIATGHYANIVNIKGRSSLKKADFLPKDQTYALYGLSQPQLERTLFPLGEYSKEEAREIAQETGLDFSRKPESQEICFIEDKDYLGFIHRVTGKSGEKGNFILSDGTVLGIHNGISGYTIGQRKGLGISFGEPLFVLKLDAISNTVVLGSDSELYSREFTVRNVNYMSAPEVTREINCIAKIRYAHKGALCTVCPTESADRLSCRFCEPQRAITPGQSAVFYDDDGVVIAGGIIE